MSAPSSSSSRGKHVTRRTMLSRREALTAEQRAAASARIAERAMDLVDHEVGKLDSFTVVALYASKGSEVDTSALDAALRAKGVTIAYPRVIDGQRELLFRAVPLEQLGASRFGLREPALDWRDAVALPSIHVMFVPGLAFDRSGWRIGWGRGHYDATLAATKGLSIGLGFECQVVDALEHDTHDARLHYVLTEANIYGGR